MQIAQVRSVYIRVTNMYDKVLSTLSFDVTVLYLTCSKGCVEVQTKHLVGRGYSYEYARSTLEMASAEWAGVRLAWEKKY